MYDTNINEIWQDADGCLYTPGLDKGTWWVMGRDTPVFEDNPNMTHPLTKVVEQDGTILVSRLNYYNKEN